MDFDIALEGIKIGPLYLRFYALCIIAGMIGGSLLARREAIRRGEDPEHVTNIVVVGAILGIIGARLYHVFDQNEWPRYQSDPITILYIWRGGIGIYGALVGAIIALVGYTWWQNLRVGRWMDIGAPGMLLGQAIGRWGNFFNQELYGRPTTLPWGIPIDAAHRTAGYEQFTHYHPLFFYESVLSFLGVAVLLYVSRRFKSWLRPGDIFLLYFIWYPAERFLLEFLRINPWKQGGIPMAQWIGGALIVAAVIALIWRHSKPAEPEAESVGPVERSRYVMLREQRRARRPRR